MESNLPPDSNPQPATPPPPAPSPPPHFNRPPPIIAPMAAIRPARRGTGWMVCALVLLVLLGMSVLLNFSQIFRGSMGRRVSPYRSTVGPRLEEVTLKESALSDKKIVVVPIEGIITGQIMDQGGYSMVTVIKEELKRAQKDRDVKAVILKVDSPGGEVLASDDIAKAIRDFQTKSGKPVIVSMGSLAASGGYYVSAPCQWIVANDLTITGSIGVIMHGLNYRGLLDKIGVRPEVFKSGKYKDMLSSTKEPEEITPEERQMVQDLIDETFHRFKDVVRDGRDAAYTANNKQGRKLAADWEDYADGRILSGTEAKRLGFVDETGDFDVAVKRAETISGISGAELVQYQQIFDLSNFFRLFGKTDSKAVKVDLGVEVPKLTPGCLYFLSPTYLH
jgi:protease-4